MTNADSNATPTDADAERTQNEATVLVVEDEPDLAEIFTTWLSDSYAVRTATDGEEALDAFDDDVDVILLDRRMPGLSGDEVLERVRGEGPDVRVVAVSAVTPDVDVVDVGFDDYLVKPVGRNDLLDAVERMLVRETYDDAVRELARLLSTKASLEASRRDEELRTHPDYIALCERIEAVGLTADETVGLFDDDDFEAVLRELDVPESESSP